MNALAAGQLAGPDYFVLVGYFALMLGIGVYFYRYMRGMKDYFSGGNQIPWWLSGVSFYMSSFSVFAFVGYSALAYEYGWVSVTLFWVTAPATVVSVVFFATKWRRARIDSPVEYLESRFGTPLRLVFAGEGVIVRVIDDALKLVAIGKFISVGLGLPMVDSMVYSGLIMLVYTCMGGLWAVAVTDFIQFIVMVAAVCVLLPMSIKEAGGLGTFYEKSPEGFFGIVTEEFSWIYLAAHLLLYSLAYSSINWSLVQRYYCVPTEKDARKVGWLVVALNIIGPPVMFIPAMAAAHFLPGVEDSTEIYPLLCMKLLPVGMLGLIIAAMFSATMSMLSSDYNVTASVLTNDFYRRLFRSGASEKELVLVGRLMTLVIGVVALGAAFFMANIGGDTLFRSMVQLFSVATAPVAVPMLLGLLSRRMTNAGAMTGFVSGVIVGLGVFFASPDEVKLFPQNGHETVGQAAAPGTVALTSASVEDVEYGLVVKKENLQLVGTFLVTTITMIVVSLIAPSKEAERKRAQAFLDRLRIPIGQMDTDRPSVDPGAKGAISPFRVVGVSTLLIGVLMLMILPWVGDSLAFWMDVIIGCGLVMFGGLVMARSPQGKTTQEGAI